MRTLLTTQNKRVIKSISLNQEQICFLQNQGITNFSKYMKNLFIETFENFPTDTKKGKKKVILPVNNHITGSCIVDNSSELISTPKKRIIRIGCHFGGIGSVEESIRQMKESGLFNDIEFIVVYSIEWDIGVRQVYIDNWDLNPEHFYTDITKVDETTLPEVDIIFTSPVCCSFSIQGLRGGFDDTRGTLIFESLRIINHQKPMYVLYENVKGLVNHDQGITFEVIQKSFKNIGYKNNWKVLNSLDFDLPQNRERIFGILSREDIEPVEFPIGERTTKSLNDFLEENVDTSYNLDTQYVINNPKYNPNGQGVLSITQTHMYTKTTFMSDQRVQCSSGFCGTLTTSSTNTKIHIKETNVSRNLTERERIRLQGFSDNFILPLKPDGTFHKTLNGKISGNTIPVPVVKSLLTQVLHSIEKSMKTSHISSNNSDYETQPTRLIS
ncbi:MAG: DNA (cytosine-5-)-methyltransferase [Sulfurimonas sp.]|jgi:DNA (cytosine-5)-methyltransferase 1